jgi:hypothetical protein
MLMSLTRDPELAAFKRNIDLHSFVETFGFRIDLKESWGLRSPRPVFVMRKGPDKITVRVDPGDGNWIFTGRDAGDGGSIIDFLQRETGANLGQVRKRLRPWSGSTAPITPWVPPANVVWKDRSAVHDEYSRMPVAEKHPYLVKVRAIPVEVLTSPRFLGRIRSDEHHNAIFPHFDAAGLCGFEKKNEDFNGFASGGIKGLWESHDLPDDNELAFIESAIEGLSYASLFPSLRRRYRSMGGNPSDAGVALIGAAILDMPEGSEVIAATNNDTQGERLAAIVEKAVVESRRPDLTFRKHLPPAAGEDWNDILRSKSFLPTARILPNVAP